MNYIQTINDIPMLRLAEEWIQSKQCPNTQSAYRIQIQKVFSNIEIRTLNTASLQSYIHSCISARESKASIILRINALKSFLTFAIRRASSPMDKDRIRFLYNTIRDVDFSVLKEKYTTLRAKVKRRVVKKELIQDILTKETDSQVRLLILLLINTGARISELLSLEYYAPEKDTDEYFNFLRWDDNRFLICVKGKGQKIREFYLNTKVSEEIIRIKPSCPGMFLLTDKQGNRLSRYAAFRILKNIQKKYLSGENLYKFGCHSFRHSYITFQKELKVDTSTIAKVVGNTPTIIERVYNHAIPDINSNFAIGV